VAANLGDKSIPAVFNPMEIWQPLTRATFTHVEMVGGFLSPNLNINCQKYQQVSIKEH
jgi:hypothetical protein